MIDVAEGGINDRPLPRNFVLTPSFRFSLNRRETPLKFFFFTARSIALPVTFKKSGARIRKVPGSGVSHR